MTDPDRSPTPLQMMEGAVDAPIIFFDEAPIFGFNASGVPGVLLCALIQDFDPDGKPFQRRKVVAQLRGSLGAFQGLLRDLQKIEELLKRPDTPPN